MKKSRIKTDITIENVIKPCDEERFKAVREQILEETIRRQGIGTLKEKTVHAVLKHYYAPDHQMHEIKVSRYVADIYTGEEIIEIQNGNFYKMREKLDVFLPLYPVTIVYPIPCNKWLIWMDEESGELSAKRKSPKRGSPYQAFAELYRIKQYLKHPNLRFMFTMIDVEEYRLLNGWSADKKKGSCRFDRIPLRIAEEVLLCCPADYLQFLPYELPEQFTSSQLAKAAKITKKTANLVLNILYYLEIVDRIGKNGRLYLYQIPEQYH